MRPAFSEAEALSLVKQFYGFTGSVSLLPSYSDQNFLIDRGDQKFVLKIANSDEPATVLDFQQQALQHVGIKAPQLSIPRVILAIDGSSVNQTMTSNDEAFHVVWMVNFMPGQFISDLPIHPPSLLEDLGIFMGSLDQALVSFQHPAMHRDLNWDLKNITRLSPLLNHIKDSNKRRLANHFLERFEKHVGVHASSLRSSVIHNDANDNNVLVLHQNRASQSNRPVKIAGIIDFGDMVHTYTIGELAIACAYMILQKEDPLSTCAHILKGYHRAFPVLEVEVKVLFDLICLRLCTSVCMSARERSLDPDNEYLAVSEQPAWDALFKLKDISPDEAANQFWNLIG